MNPLNYESYEAAKRLVEAGIVLNTECNWVHIKNGDWHLVNEYKPSDSIDLVIPAPNMAEVWRELNKYRASLYFSESNNVTLAVIEGSPSFYNANPTDALIDLLIWVRKEKK